MAQVELQEPEGISFFNIKSGDTHFAKLEPTIAAYINSSDMGINASRGQDYGWKLGVEWVKRVREFRRDNTQMQILTARNNGQRPTTTQILYYLYGEDLRAFEEEAEEHENPFEDQYLKDIAGGTGSRAARAAKAKAKAAADLDDDEISDLVDDDDLLPADLTPEEQAKADEVELAKMEAEEKAAKAKAAKATKRSQTAQ